MVVVVVVVVVCPHHHQILTIRGDLSDDGKQTMFSCPRITGECLFQLVAVTEEQLRKTIVKSKPTYSSVDPVPMKIVWDCLAIYYACHAEKARLDPNVPKHIRPVSNLPYISKLLERVVTAQLVEHLAKHTLLDRFQSTYRPEHSTDTAVLRLLNDILCSADGGNLVLLVLLNLKDKSKVRGDF